MTRFGRRRRPSWPNAAIAPSVATSSGRMSKTPAGDGTICEPVAGDRGYGVGDRRIVPGAIVHHHGAVIAGAGAMSEQARVRPCGDRPVHANLPRAAGNRRRCPPGPSTRRGQPLTGHRFHGVTPNLRDVHVTYSGGRGPRGAARIRRAVAGCLGGWIPGHDPPIGRQRALDQPVDAELGATRARPASPMRWRVAGSPSTRHDRIGQRAGPPGRHEHGRSRRPRRPRECRRRACRPPAGPWPSRRAPSSPGLR